MTKSLNLYASEGETPRLDLLDWNFVSQEVIKKIHFKLSIIRLEKPLLFVHSEDLNHYHNILDAVLELKSNDKLEGLEKELQLIRNDTNITLLFSRMSKNDLPTLEDFFQLVLASDILNYLLKQDMFGSYLGLDERIQRKILSHRKIFEKDGSIIFSNHPRLSKIYSDIQKNEKLIKTTLLKLMNSSPIMEALQINNYDYLDGQFVLPIKTDNYESSMGRILFHSNTGSTLYIQPKEIRKLNDLIQDLNADLEYQILLIRRELSSLFLSFEAELVPYLNQLYEIDLLFAKANYIFEQQLTRPKINHNGSLSFKEIKNILVADCIPNNFQLTRDQKGACLSGPNTGGKSIFLKAISLSQLMVKSGLYVPCYSADMALFDELYYFSGDGQSLEVAQSSFSSELHNYLSMIEHMSDNSLIVFDEIFNSTNSDEGSAIALALLDKISREFPNSKVLLSTHHTLLKKELHLKEDFKSLSMSFDTINNRTTYKVIEDLPGMSLALLVLNNFVANTNNIDIAENANFILQGQDKSYENLLIDLNEQHINLEKIRKEAEEKLVLINRRLNALDGEVQLKRDQKLSDLNQEIESRLRLLEKILDKVKEKGKIADTDFSKINRLKEVVKKDNNKEIPLVIPKSLEIHNMYFSKGLKNDVKLIKINGKKAIVTMGKLKTTVSLDDLRQRRDHINTSSSNISVSVTLDNSFQSTRLDLRGMNIDQAQEAFDSRSGHLLTNSIPFLEVIHGHGDGILRKWLRKYVSGSGSLSFEVPENSDDGHTIVHPRK